MEVTPCIRAVVVASNQYRNNPSDANLIHLQRQLDVLNSVTAKEVTLQMFDPKQLLCTECLSCLVDIVGDSHTKPSLVEKTFTLLQNLATVNEIRVSLHSIYHLTASLANFLKVQSASDPLTIQCVKLLQKITYKSKVSFQENYVEDLIKFLLTQIKAKENEITQPCMGLLANLCRNNFSIQTHIKHMENVKSFIMTLINYLSHRNHTTVVFALSILTSLCLHEELGEKLFNAQNINQTFQLMFNILVHGDSGVTRRYVVDLFTDLLNHSKIQNSLSIYDHLGRCVKQVLALLCSSKGESVSKVFELLLSFCSVNEIRSVVCKTLVESTNLQDPIQYKQLLAQHEITEPFFAVVHWAGQSVESHDKTPLLALEFLKEVYEEMIDLELTSTVSPRTDLVLPMLTETLMTPVNQKPYLIGKQCQKVVFAVQLFLVLCTESNMTSQVAESIDSKTLTQLLDYQLSHNNVGINFIHNMAEPDNWSENGVDVVLYTLDFMLKMRQHVPNTQKQFSEYLQDPRLVPFLAYGMTSELRDRVQISLRLISIGASLEEFPSVVLGDSIAANNSTNKSRPSDFEDVIIDDSPRSPPRQSSTVFTSSDDKENMPRSKLTRKNKKTNSADLDSSVQSLIEKMQSGFQMKDMKVSEIINVYEHRLQSLQTKENHLQDLIEAKATALSQADRLISQYRCRRAQSEAEAQKIRALLQDSERKSEDYREQLNEMLLERERVQTELDHYVQENGRLTAIADEHKELTVAFAEQTQRLENLQRSFTTLKQEHQSMCEMHEMLRRHNETLKQQHDVASQQLLELEEERKSQSRQLKEKEAKVAELSKSLQKSETSLKKLGKERDEFETAIDKLRDNIGKQEENKRELEHQITSLELLCRQHEKDIKEKDQTLQNQKAQLDKLGQLTAIIHNLSSGNATPDISAMKM